MANYYLVLKEGNQVVDCVKSEESKFEVHESFEWVEGPDMEEGKTVSDYEYLEDNGIALKSSPDVSYEIHRRFNYPSFADQFDLLYHGGYDAWKAEITKIKEQYPKPEE